MSRAVRRAVAAIGRRHAGDAWQSLERVHGATESYRTGGYRGNLVEAWKNTRYAVLVYVRSMPDGSATKHLAIRRADEGTAFPWADLQRIKNEVVGAEAVAVEVFPAESQLVDAANMRHLFVWPASSDCPFTIEGEWS